ncbi:hypothetical protein FPRO06_01760 [Fusarium proliferatum]|nr:hypothetical protein FPRO06_01760 [Fusarium proliferatum]CVL02961.1 uncharacterized protein FPRN_00175 [Fusarium proliferatum]
MSQSSQEETEAETMIVMSLEETFRHYAHHVVWIKYAWVHGTDGAVKEAFRRYVHPSFIEGLQYPKDGPVWATIQRNLDSMMNIVVQISQIIKPFQFNRPDLGLIFVAWLIKTKEIISRDLPNLSGQNALKALAEMNTWLAIIGSKGGRHVERIKVSPREIEFNEQIWKMKNHLGIFGRR